MAEEGEAWVRFHADTDSVEPEAARGIKRAAENLEDDELKDIGEGMGDALADGMGDGLEKSGPKLARSVEKGLGKQKIKTKVTTEFDRDGKAIRKWVSTVTDEMEDAFAKAGTPGGPLSRIGTAITDAIGAGFSVSGKSPLIVLLIPLIGVIIGLVLAAVQAVGSLVAILITVPALIGAVVAQAGVLMLAWEGVGKAVTGAFAAKNAKELNEAIKGLTPSAQAFVKQLLTAKEFFKQLQKLAQENFFKALGNTFLQIKSVLSGPIFRGVRGLATALGGFFRALGLFFASNTFKDFVNKLFPSTIRFLEKFGPSFVTFLDGLIALTTAAIPFLNAIGDMLGGNLAFLGVLFKDIANDASFQTWLTDMSDTLASVVELLGQVTAFIATFMAQLNEAGGVTIIDALADAFELMTFFLASPAGLKAMEGLINLAIISIKAFTGVLLAIMLIFAALEEIGEFFNNDLLPLIEFIGFAVGFTFAFIAGVIGDFFPWLGGKIAEFFGFADRTIQSVGRRVTGTFAAVQGTVSRSWNMLLAEVRSIPGRITSALGSLKNLLFSAGRNLLEGLVNGIKSSFSYLWNTLSWITGTIGGFFNHSPAKWGPLAGKGDPLYSGQEFVKRLATGMTMEAPALRSASTEATSNIIFGPNSIGVNFNGALPTNQQASSTGSAVGSGILNQLAMRDTRLAVRTL